MHTPTFQLRFNATPSVNSSQYRTHGEAYVVCWIVRPTIELAKALAIASMAADGWDVQELDEVCLVERDDYEDAEDRDFFDQAQLDGEVYSLHCSPRFTVYDVHLALSRRQDDADVHAEAHYLVLNESVGSPDCDFYDLEFWNAERRAVALERATVAVAEAGWQVDAVKGAGPIDWLTAEPELLELAELAEDDGECLVIVHG